MEFDRKEVKLRYDPTINSVGTCIEENYEGEWRHVHIPKDCEFCGAVEAVRYGKVGAGGLVTGNSCLDCWTVREYGEKKSENPQSSTGAKSACAGSASERG